MEEIIKFNIEPEYHTNGTGGDDTPTPGEIGYIAPAIWKGMQTLSELLLTDVGATWAAAGEMATGRLTQAAIFSFGPVGVAVAAVGMGAYAGTTWLDQHLDGAIHTWALETVERIMESEFFDSDRYFGDIAEGNFEQMDVQMMSDICSNWEDWWEDVPVQGNIIAPIQPALMI